MNHTKILRIQRKHLRWLIVVAGLMMVLAALACEVPRLTNEQIAGLEDPDFLESLGGDPYIIAYPDVACPGEVITVEWDGPDRQPDSCAIDPGTCYYGTVYSAPDILRVEDTLGGSDTIVPDAALGTTFWFYYALNRLGDTSPGLSRSDDIFLLTADLGANPSGRVADIEHTYSLMCDPDTNTWAWEREDTSDHRWGNESMSACLGIVGTCSSVPTVSLSTPDGASGTVDPSNDFDDGRCFPSGVDNYAPQDVTAENTDPAYAGVIGSPCSPGDAPPVDSGMESFVMYYWVACTSDLQGPAADNCIMGTSEEITSDSGESDDSAEENESSDEESESSEDIICANVPDDGTCCIEGGENHLNSPNDCAAPPPACGSPCSSDAQCAGLGVNPVCAGGFCYDAGMCDAASSDGGGGSSEGGGSGAVCGNGIVEAGEQCEGIGNGSCNWAGGDICNNDCTCDTFD